MSAKRRHVLRPLIDQLLRLPQYLIPHHLASRAVGWLTHTRQASIKNLLIDQVVKIWHVDLSTAIEQNTHAYPDFNRFFTRALKPGARPVTEGQDDIASPVDGTISAFGDIAGSHLFQAKGCYYTLCALLGGSNSLAHPFSDGRFATLYLSPRDYHRIHMPMTGRLLSMRYIPGRLFSVNPATTRTVDALFARNERVVTVFSTEAGMMALVIVGAMFVGGIETVWHGVITPSRQRTIQQWDYTDQQVILRRGEEMGRFNMGSTVIVLFGRDRIRWADELQNGAGIRMGQYLARHLKV